MRTTLIVISLTALLAVGAGSAAANPRGAGERTPGGSAPVALQHRYVGRDLVAVAPDTQVALDPARSSGAPAAPAAEPGFRWGDAAVGAGLLAAVLALSAGGLALVRRDRPLAAR